VNKHILILFTFSTYFCSAQNQNSEKKTTQALTYKVSYAIDSLYGITMFEALNDRLGGDSIRVENGRASNGWKKIITKLENYCTRGFMSMVD